MHVICYCHALKMVESCPTPLGHPALKNAKGLVKGILRDWNQLYKLLLPAFKAYFREAYYTANY